MSSPNNKRCISHENEKESINDDANTGEKKQKNMETKNFNTDAGENENADTFPLNEKQIQEDQPTNIPPETKFELGQVMMEKNKKQEWIVCGDQKHKGGLIWVKIETFKRKATIHHVKKNNEQNYLVCFFNGAVFIFEPVDRKDLNWVSHLVCAHNVIATISEEDFSSYNVNNMWKEFFMYDSNFEDYDPETGIRFLRVASIQLGFTEEHLVVASSVWKVKFPEDFLYEYVDYWKRVDGLFYPFFVDSDTVFLFLDDQRIVTFDFSFKCSFSFSEVLTNRKVLFRSFSNKNKNKKKNHDIDNKKNNFQYKDVEYIVYK